MTQDSQKNIGKLTPTKSSNIGVFQIYNGQILEMRREGRTLQMIGDTIGVTRERIRQVLNKYYGGTDMPFLTIRELAQRVGYSEHTVYRLTRAGILNPKRVGWLYLFGKEDIKKAIAAMSCKHCGAPRVKRSRLYCAACSLERRRYPYPFMNDEAKRHHNAACRRWEELYPERKGEIHRRAAKKYYEKVKLR